MTYLLGRRLEAPEASETTPAVGGEGAALDALNTETPVAQPGEAAAAAIAAATPVETTPPAAPASTETPAATPAEGQATPTTAAPASSEQAPLPAADDDEPEPTVAWDEHREVRVERDRLGHENQTLRSQIAQFETQVQETRTQYEGLARNYTGLQEALRRNPDLLDALEEREQARIRGGGGGQPAARIDPVLDRRLSKIEEGVNAFAQRTQSEQQAQAEAEAQAAWQRMDKEIDDAISAQLTRRGLDVEGNLRAAKLDILDQARRINGCQTSDIPVLFNRWYKSYAQRKVAGDAQYRNDKAADRAALPTPPAGGGMSVTAKPDFGAMDGKTNAAMIEGMKRLGFGQAA